MSEPPAPTWRLGSDETARNVALGLVETTVRRDVRGQMSLIRASDTDWRDVCWNLAHMAGALATQLAHATGADSEELLARLRARTGGTP